MSVVQTDPSKKKTPLGHVKYKIIYYYQNYYGMVILNELQCTKEEDDENMFRLKHSKHHNNLTSFHFSLFLN